MKIANKAALDQWMSERMKMGRDLFAIKGDAPKGACYSDGDAIDQPINVAWRDGSTGEVFAIEYDFSQ